MAFPERKIVQQGLVILVCNAIGRNTPFLSDKDGWESPTKFSSSSLFHPSCSKLTHSLFSLLEGQRPLTSSPTQAQFTTSETSLASLLLQNNSRLEILVRAGLLQKLIYMKLRYLKTKRNVSIFAGTCNNRTR